MTNRERKKKQAESNPPINFTCGNCKKIIPFDEKKPYVCPDCDYCGGNLPKDDVEDY